jgi:hypothetical protein
MKAETQQMSRTIPPTKKAVDKAITCPLDGKSMTLNERTAK